MKHNYVSFKYKEPLESLPNLHNAISDITMWMIKKYYSKTESFANIHFKQYFSNLSIGVVDTPLLSSYMVRDILFVFICVISKGLGTFDATAQLI